MPLCSWARNSNKALFQVWVIANKVQGSHGLSRGTVCRRTGVQPREPKGQGWDYGIGVSALAIWACFIALCDHSSMEGGGRLLGCQATWFSDCREAGTTSLSGPMPLRDLGTCPGNRRPTVQVLFAAEASRYGDKDGLSLKDEK